MVVAASVTRAREGNLVKSRDLTSRWCGMETVEGLTISGRCRWRLKKTTGDSGNSEGESTKGKNSAKGFHAKEGHQRLGCKTWTYCGKGRKLFRRFYCSRCWNANLFQRKKTRAEDIPHSHLAAAAPAPIDAVRPVTMAEDAPSSSSRRLESIRRHLLPRPPSVLSLNPLSAAQAGPNPVIIGGMVLDIHAKPSVAPHPGTTVPGMVKYIGGGVARNIAECMAKLGTQPLIISVVGNDMAGDFLLKYWRSAGLCTDGILQVHDVATPVVSNVFDGSGELIAGIASVQAVETFLTPNWIYQFSRHISTAPLLMLDANLSPQSLQAACKIAYESGVPVLFEPVSVVKSSRIAPIAQHITCTSPNEIELVAMANALSTPGKYNFVKLEQCHNKTEAVDHLFEMLSPAMFFLLEKGIKLLLVTLGLNGVFICCKEHIDIMKDQRMCRMTALSAQLLEKLEGCFPPSALVNLSREGSSRTCVFHLPATTASVISLTGAGDCLVGGVLSSLCGGLDIMQSVAVGIATAKASVESEANIPAIFSAASIADEARKTLLSAKQIWCQ